MVDVEHRGLTTLEHHDLIAVERLGDQVARVGDHRPQPLGVGEQVFHDLVARDRTAVEDLHQQVVLLVESALDLLAQDVLVEQILHPDADTVDLVGVRRADAAAGRADVALAEEPLRHLVERAVVLRDDVRVGADLQPRDVDATGGERLQLGEQHLEVDDHAVADHRSDAGRQDAGGQQVQRVLLVADDDGVSGVVAAVELHHPVGALTEQIGGLALSFVAPLHADDNDSWHG